MNEQATRFIAKRDGAHGAVVKDNVTGRIVATFPPDLDHPEMARRFADAATYEFNRRYKKALEDKKQRGW